MPSSQTICWPLSMYLLQLLTDAAHRKRRRFQRDASALREKRQKRAEDTGRAGRSLSAVPRQGTTAIPAQVDGRGSVDLQPLPGGTSKSRGPPEQEATTRQAYQPSSILVGQRLGVQPLSPGNALRHPQRSHEQPDQGGRSAVHQDQEEKKR